MYDLLQVMQQDGYLSSGELIALRKTCKELGENPVRVLRSLNIASPEQIQEYLQRYFRVNALGDQAIAFLDETYQSYIPIDIAVHYSCFGLGEENSSLYVAMEDPSDRGTIQQLRFFLNKRIVPIAATVFQLADGLTKIYRVSVPNLRLTTVIERSRGVIGGLRYEAPFESKALTIDSDYSGENLSDADSESVNDFVKKSANNLENENAHADEEPSPEISFPEMNKSIYTPSPSVGFIDGSSGEVAKGVLDIEETKEASSPEQLTATEESVASAAAAEQTNAAPVEMAQNEVAAEPTVEAAGATEGISEEAAVGEPASSEEVSATEGISEEAAVGEPASSEEISAAEGISEEAAVGEPASSEEISAAEGISEEAAVGEPASSEEISATEGISEEVAEGIREEVAGAEPESEGLSEEIETEQAVSQVSEAGIVDDTALNENHIAQEELNENQVSQLSAMVSSALIKVTLMQNQDQAMQYVNTMLEPFQISVTFAGNSSYQIKGENFSVEGNATTTPTANDNPIYCVLDPVLKNILKMKLNS